MSYNFINYDGSLVASDRCLHDSNLAYEANFNVDGEVDGWLLFDGIHTYGCWNNFLFGTLYDTYGMIGRYEPIRPIEAESFYFVRIVMKLNVVDRNETQPPPKYGKIAWRTISSPIWNSDKEQLFELNTDQQWHTYYINMAPVQWWQGDVSDLRIYPIESDGRDGDEFFIRTLEVLSVDSYRCLNVSCDYYNNYEHNCPGIGTRGTCASAKLGAYILGGTAFEFADTTLFTVEEDVNDLLLININEYGFENIIIPPMVNVNGTKLAKAIAKEISKLNVGGYAECNLTYTEYGQFIIYNGVFADDSVVSIGDTPLARELNFYNDNGDYTSTETVGSYPASGFSPYSSFKIKTHQIHALLDDSQSTEFYFNPFIYNVEGGRRDWLETGLGKPTRSVKEAETEDSGVQTRLYSTVPNAGKTIIEFCHPFNASGRITNVYAGLTLDTFVTGDWREIGDYNLEREENQLKDAKIMFFRPLKNGDIRVLPMEIPITNRAIEEGKLYSAVQEYVELKCDLFVNKGDLMGVYNANVYRSRSITGEEIDALYYQVDGEATGILKVKQPLGQGMSGLLMYARSNQIQHRLVLEVDLGKRLNVSNVEVIGRTDEQPLQFNAARCLDIDWEVDLFGHNHSTGWIRSYRPLRKAYFNHPNIYYGKDCLTDGIKDVPDGLSADSFDIEVIDNNYQSLSACQDDEDGGRGVIPHGAKYFWVNGDNEWLFTYLHAGKPSPFLVKDFHYDPIAFTLKFPLEKDKFISGTKIYFKEQYNFRSFVISTFAGEHYVAGDADDPRFNTIPIRSDYPTPWKRVVLDGLVYEPEDETTWEGIDLYLANNPCIGHVIEIPTGAAEVEYNKYMAYYDEMDGLSYYQTFKIINNEQYTQATATDWTVLEYEWEPVSAKGFRLYCYNHESTKLCEFEVYCPVQHMDSTMAGSVDLLFSPYGDRWWPSDNKEVTNGVECFIGDTPRYIDITIKPIVETILSDVVVNVSYEDVFMGEKGCQYISVPIDVKRAVEDNPAKKIDFKNVYGRAYDLYVDIAAPEVIDEGTVFYSTLENPESIDNPIIGADAFYRKHVDFSIFNYEKNVAINCPVFALKNLTDGKDAWYSHDNEYSWKYYGKIESGNKFNFSNLPNASITEINLPVLTRSKWWKIGFVDPRIVMSVKEIQLYYEGEEIFGINFYHHKDAPVETTPNTDTAPHLKNDIIDGSYYVIKGDHHIGFELPEVQMFDKILIYHDFLLEYENDSDKAGIDSSTSLCIHGLGSHLQTDSIIDESYYEHDVTVVGDGVYCDTQSETTYYEFTEDFTSCAKLVKDFSEPEIDLTYWTNLVGASLVDETLHVTNSGVVGEVSTIPYFYDNFTVLVDLAIDNNYDGQGWGCYLEAFNDDSHVVRVGRSFRYYRNYQIALAEYKGTTGWWNIGVDEVSDTTGMQLGLTRTDGVISCFIYNEDGANLISLGSSTTLDNSPVRFRLVSDYTPLAPPGEVTTAIFDNFRTDGFGGDWSENTVDNSSFTCTSGVGPNGAAYVYDTICSNSSNASGYKHPDIFETNNYPLDSEFAFTFNFAFQAEEFMDVRSTPISTNICGVSVGILGKHVKSVSENNWRYYFTGVQVVLRRDQIGIGIRDEWTSGDDSFVSLDTRAAIYYCSLTGDGYGHYECHVWTDDWSGSNEVATISLDSDVKWTAYKIGVGSGHSDLFNFACRAKGWVSDFDFSCDETHANRVLHTSSIKFSGFQDEHLLVNYESNPQCNVEKDSFFLDTKRFTFDFFISFNSLPTEEGEYITLFGCWDPEQPLTEGGPVTTGSSWLFILVYTGSSYRWRFYVNDNHTCSLLMDYAFQPDIHRWYHFYFCKGPEQYDETRYFVFLRDGHIVWGNYAVSFGEIEVIYSGRDVVIGDGLDGWMEEIRISADYTKGGSRCYYFTAYPETLAKPVPTKQYERYYTWSFYESVDNIRYSKNFDADTLFDNSYSYHLPQSYWSRQYYTYLAIDFGQRHSIGFIRSFPIDTSYQFTKESNILYSNTDTADPVAAFGATSSERDLSTDFSEYMDHDYPSDFTNLDTSNAESYTIDSRFFQSCSSSNEIAICTAQSNFYFRSNFSFYIDYDLGDNFVESGNWFVELLIEDANADDNKLSFSRCFFNNDSQYKLDIKDNSEDWTTKLLLPKRDIRQTIKVERVGSIFTFSTKRVDLSTDSFVKIYNYQMRGDYAADTRISLRLTSEAPNYPKAKVWWDNFVVSESTNSIFSSSNDTRWARIKMLNGDGEERTIENVGIYPDITKRSNLAGQFNNYWEPLGTAVTSYADAVNVAFGATVSGSSYVGSMNMENVINGMIPDGTFNDVWGAEDDEDLTWLTITLLEDTPIFRFRLFHGYNTADTNTIITDYRIQTSLDNETFTTVFEIIDNDEFIRTHDLVSPVTARYVRLVVDDYDAVNRFVYANDNNYRFWKGPVLREFEIYKYYGFTVISSEEHPVIAVDLQDAYFIDGHDMVGIDAEDDEIDWDNSDTNFAWGSSWLSDPSKVEFSDWGDKPGYEKWVAVIRNTAEHYPKKPTGSLVNTDTADYLKHLIIKASRDNYGGKPNPVETPWFWRSLVSDLSMDYNKIYSTYNNRTLRIDYPAGTETEHVSYIEGDHFGIDDVASWRDGFGFFIYIDDIDNLDLEYGYFYLGGTDYTEKEAPVIHRWNMTTFSGSMQSGWNNMSLLFSSADTITYTKLGVTENGPDPRILYSIDWGKMGFVFRGKGAPLQINIGGTFIQRNHFQSRGFPGHAGLYLHANDVLKLPVGELDPRAATIEFFVTPDWDWNGTDIYRDFKFRTLFHLSNVANDMVGVAITNRGVELYYGNLILDFNMVTVEGFTFSAIDELMHIAVAFSNDASGMTSNKATIRLYVNNTLIAENFDTWHVSDTKHFNFMFGGQGQLNQKYFGSNPRASAVDGVVSRLKIHNYCKTNFDESMPGFTGTSTDKILKPDSFVAISRDNVTFHKVGSSDLPFFFDNVPDGDSVPIWVKVILPRALTGHEKRTAEILGSWDIGV